MEEKVHFQTIIYVVISTLIVLNVFGSVLSKNFEIPSFWFSAIPDVFLFIYVVIRKNGKMRIDPFILLMFSIAVLISVMHVINDGNVFEEVKSLMYIVTFILLYQCYDKNLWNVLELTISVISIFLIIDAIRAAQLTLSNGYGLRNFVHYTVLDKSYYTLFLSLSWIFSFLYTVNYKNQNGQWKKIRIIFLLFVLSVGIIIVQSKVFLFIVIISCFYVGLNLKKRNKLKFISLFLFMMIVFFCVLSFCPDYVPDYIYVLINKNFGLFSEYVYNIPIIDKLTSTYVNRSLILNYAFSLFLDHPLWGVGFGQYASFASLNTSILATQTESSWLNLLVEGGLIYFINHLFFVFYLIYKSVKTSRNSFDFVFRTRSLLIIIAYIVLNLFNDYFSCIYWLFLSALFGESCSNKRVAENR